MSKVIIGLHYNEVMSSDEYFVKAIDFVSPKVDAWIKELFGGVEALKLSRPQKELIQALTVKTLVQFPDDKRAIHELR